MEARMISPFPAAQIHWHLFWSFLCISLLSVSLPLQATLQRDVQLLLDFKQQLNGEGRVPLNTWDEANDKPCGRWEGVACDSHNSTVLGLRLQSKSLRGTLSESLCSLENLQWLDLSDNNLTGEIPPEIANATHLVTLDLGKNMFTGSIPSGVSQLQSLEYLNLGDNLLTGTIPSLHGLTNLSVLFLHNNQLTGGIANLTGLTNLGWLWLNCNNLRGPLTNLEHLEHLETLFLKQNKFTGRIPDLAGMQKLEFLDMSENQLEGRVPSGIADMPMLKYLNLSFNQLSGEIPREIWKNSSNYLKTIDLSSNRLNGSIAGELLYWARSLQLLWLNNNLLEGDIDQIWTGAPGQVSILKDLRLQGNRFHGSIGSVSRDNWKYLELLDLSHNYLSLDISGYPRILETLFSLRELRLGSNNSTGTLPTRVGLPVLEILDLSNSNLFESL